MRGVPRAFVTPRSRLPCPLCGRQLEMDITLTGRLCVWTGRCAGGEDEGPLEGAHLERHRPARIEMSAKPEEGGSHGRRDKR